MTRRLRVGRFGQLETDENPTALLRLQRDLKMGSVLIRPAWRGREASSQSAVKSVRAVIGETQRPDGALSIFGPSPFGLSPFGLSPFRLGPFWRMQFTPFSLK